jgi:hypothetical protein
MLQQQTLALSIVAVLSIAPVSARAIRPHRVVFALVAAATETVQAAQLAGSALRVFVIAQTTPIAAQANVVMVKGAARSAGARLRHLAQILTSAVRVVCASDQRAVLRSHVAAE